MGIAVAVRVLAAEQDPALDRCCKRIEVIRRSAQRRRRVSALRVGAALPVGDVPGTGTRNLLAENFPQASERQLDRRSGTESMDALGVRAGTEDDQRRLAADPVDVDPEREPELWAAGDVEDVGVERIGPEGFVEAHRDLLDPAEADSLDGCDLVVGQGRVETDPSTRLEHAQRNRDDHVRAAEADPAATRGAADDGMDGHAIAEPFDDIDVVRQPDLLRSRHRLVKLPIAADRPHAEATRVQKIAVYRLVERE